jgi:putative heme degradation protein
MIRRFCRPSTEVSATTEKAYGKGTECKFCAALRRARELELFDPLQELCSPLTPGVQLVNLSHSEDGQMLRVELGDDWKRMFEQLPLIGDGLVMTRNEAAILGRYMTFPELAFTTHGIKGVSECGGLRFDFRALCAARAVHQRCALGHIFGLEFADGAGHTIHRFTATPTSNLEVFLGWVRLHQACSGHRNHWSQVDEDDAWVLTGSEAMDRATGSGAILSILTASYERRLGVRVTVHTSGAVQRAQFIPQSLQAVGDWWFACDEVVGLHFCNRRFTHAKIATQPNERVPRLLLYCHTDAERPALILEASDEWPPLTWWELLHTIA